jgi:hypothetical protein
MNFCRDVQDSEFPKSEIRIPHSRIPKARFAVFPGTPLLAFSDCFRNAKCGNADFGFDFAKHKGHRLNSPVPFEDFEDPGLDNVTLVRRHRASSIS